MQSKSTTSINRIVNAAMTRDSQELEALASEALLLGSKHNSYSAVLSQVQSLYEGVEQEFVRREVPDASELASTALRRIGYKAAVRSPVEGDRVFMAVHETVYNGPW